jgi:type VII secretion protein EccB
VVRESALWTEATALTGGPLVQTRRDQLAAYRYSVRRVLTALMGSEPEQVEQPMRRVASATLAGVMVTVLALTGAGFYGKLRGGSPSSWQRSDVLIVERDTGSRYVWTGSELRPVLNYSSARLLLRQPDIQTVKVSRRAIAGARRGAPVGITGAPDSLPDAQHVVSAPWSVCTTRADQAAISTLIIGTPVQGHHLADDSLLVRSTGQYFLIWHGKRLSATADDVRSLGLDPETALDVPAPWVNAVPSGPDLAAPSIAGTGRPGPTVAGHATRLGDVVEATSATDAQWYVALADGVSPISETQALLLTGSRGAGLVRATTADINASRISQQRWESADIPTARPRLAATNDGSPICVEAITADGKVPATPVLSLGGDLPALSPVRPGVTTSQTVDQLVVEPGAGAVVSVLTSGGAQAPGTFLITDAGLRFAIPTSDIVSWLGYSTIQPVPIPSRLLALVPQGPALDPTTARGTAGVRP